MKKVKGIILSLIVSIASICMMPFSVYADSFTIDNVIGVNVVGMEIVSNTQSDVTCEVVLDDNYTGSFTLKFSYSLSGSTVSVSKYIFVNGNKAQFTFLQAGTTIPSITKTSVSNVEMYRSSEFDFPIESLTAVMSLGMNGHSISNIDNVGKYKYPTFSIPSHSTNTDNSNICSFTINPSNDKANSYVLIFGINKNIYSESSMINQIGWTYANSNVSTTAGWQYVETLFRNNLAPYSIVKVRFFISQVGNNSPSITVYTLNECKFTPIYFNYEYPDNISLDFALNFHLDNELLKALQNISGDNSSDQAADNLDDDAMDMQDNFDDMFTIENQYNQDLNNQIDNIDFTNPLSGNQSLLSSGNFVLQVFNGLIANNPISLLIIIACILLVARRLFG